MNNVRKQRWLIIGLLISNVVLITFLVLGHPSFRQHGAPKKIVVERLDFSPTQEASYLELIRDHQQRAAAIDTRMNELRLKLYKGLNDQPIVDESTVLGQLAILQTEAEQAKLDHFRAVKEICTPEQMEKFEALTDELGKIFSHRGPKHPRRMGQQ